MGTVMKTFSVLSVLFHICYVQGALLHPDSEVVLGQGYAIPPFTLQRAGAAAAVQSIHRPRQVKVVKTFSEFDDPDGWNPVKEKYDKNDYNDRDLKGKKTVTGPPFGDIPESKKVDKTEAIKATNAWKPYYDSQ